MSIVGAFIEIQPGHTEPNWFDWENVVTGKFNSKGSWGLNVDWSSPVPDDTQVYLVWSPQVIAVWNDEEEIENGEDGEDADGSNPVERDEAVSAESDLGAGEGGEGDGDLPAAGDEGQPEEAE